MLLDKAHDFAPCARKSRFDFFDGCEISKNIVAVSAIDWLDDEAVAMTGLDEGWRAFHEYWITDGGMRPGEDYWCMLVCEDDTPMAVIALSLHEGCFHIMELLVKPDQRGRGLGTALLGVLLSKSEMIIGQTIEKASALIFLKNDASKKAFEKAGFIVEHIHEDGNAWNAHFNRGGRL